LTDKFILRLILHSRWLTSIRKFSHFGFYVSPRRCCSPSHPLPVLSLSLLTGMPAIVCSDWYSAGSMRPDCNWTTKFCSQWTSHMELSATSTMVTGECLEVGTEDTPVLDCPAPLRCLHDSGAGYKYPYLLAYLPILQE